MCTVEKIASCQISFLPIGSSNYLGEINQVLALIQNSGLEINIGTMSTVVRGDKSKVLKLITDIYQTMEDVCSFTMDVKLSNLCGCGK